MAIDKAQAAHRASVGLCVLALVLEILGYTCPGWLLVTTDLSILTLGTSLTGFGQVSSRAGVWYVDVCVMGDSNTDCTHASEHEARQMGFNLSPVFNAVSRIDWSAVQAVLTLALLCCCVGAVFAFLGLCSTKTVGTRTSTLIAAAGMMLSGVFVLPAVVLVGTALQTSKDKASAIEETTGHQFVQFEVPWALVLSAIGLAVSFTCSVILVIVTFKHEQPKDFTTPYGDIVPPAIITTGKFPTNIVRVRKSIDEGIAPPVFKKLQGNKDDAGSVSESTEEKKTIAESKPFVHPPPSSKTTPDGQPLHVTKVPLLPFKTTKQTVEMQTKTKDNGIAKNKDMNRESEADKQNLKNINDAHTVTADPGIIKSKTEAKPSTNPSNNNQGANGQLSQQKTVPTTTSKASNKKGDSVKNQESKSVVKSSQNSTVVTNPVQIDSTNTNMVKDTEVAKKGMVLKADKNDKSNVNIDEKEAPKHAQQDIKAVKKTDYSTPNKEVKVQMDKQSEKSNNENTTSPQAKFIPSKSIPPKPAPPKPVPRYAKLTQSQIIKLEAKNKNNDTNRTSIADKSTSQDQKSDNKETVPHVKETQAQRSEKKSFFSVISSPIKRLVLRNGTRDTDKEHITPGGQKQTEPVKRKESKKSPAGQSSPSNKRVKHSTTKIKTKRKHGPSKSHQTSQEGAKKKKKKIHRKTKRRHRIRGKRHKQEKEPHESEEETDTDSSSEDENTDNDEAVDMNSDDQGKVPITIHVTECKASNTANTMPNDINQPLKANVVAQDLSVSNKGNTKKEQETKHESHGNDTNQRNGVGKNMVDAENGRSTKSADKGNNGRSIATEKANGGKELARVSCETDGGRDGSFDRQSSDTSSTTTSDTKNSDTVLTVHI